jgi:hypothetical protein
MYPSKFQVPICKAAFLSIYGIHQSRLEKKVLNFSEDAQDGRGQHGHPIRIPVDVIDAVHRFLQSLPAIESHYTRRDNFQRKFLHPDLNILILYRRYSELYPNLAVSPSKFRQIFNEDFNFSFGLPRKDICNLCTQYTCEIANFKSKENITDADRVQKVKDKHVEQADSFYDEMVKTKKRFVDRSNSKLPPDTLAICFDFQKNFPLPKTNVQIEYYKRQLWFHNFGVHDLATGKATMYVFTENVGSKGPNEVISALQHSIELHKLPTHTNLIIFADNCYPQNKNKYMFMFLDTLCQGGQFQSVKVFYPVPGHSMMAIDADFGSIKKEIKKYETVYNPMQYVRKIENARVKNKFEIFCLKKPLGSDFPAVIPVYDFKNFFEKHLTNNNGISKCKMAKIEYCAEPMIKPTSYMGPYKAFPVCKPSSMSVILRTRNTKLVEMRDFIEISKLKLKDVQCLLQYVPESESEYYKEVLRPIERDSNQDDEDYKLDEETIYIEYD